MKPLCAMAMVFCCANLTACFTHGAPSSVATHDSTSAADPKATSTRSPLTPSTDTVDHGSGCVAASPVADADAVSGVDKEFPNRDGSSDAGTLWSETGTAMDNDAAEASTDGGDAATEVDSSADTFTDPSTDDAATDEPAVPTQDDEPIPPPPADADGDGFNTTSDCNDEDAAIHPGAQELCNGLDDDCNGTVDDKVADPPLGDRQKGLCAGSLKQCADGTWVEPNYNTIPNYQISENDCDGLDNDCDGDVDWIYVWDEWTDWWQWRPCGWIGPWP